MSIRTRIGRKGRGNTEALKEELGIYIQRERERERERDLKDNYS